MDRLRVKASGPGQVVGQLSGGNQQKVVLGKWLARQPRVLILDEPTRGVDVGARSEIYALMDQLAGQGVAILMISSDMEEVLGMSDRVLVMHEGRLAGSLGRADMARRRSCDWPRAARPPLRITLPRKHTTHDSPDRHRPDGRPPEGSQRERGGR